MGAGTAPDDVGVFIVNIKGLVLDPVAATPGSIVRIEPRKETEYESQLWRLREDGTIEHVNTGLILSIPGGTGAPVGTKITINQVDPACSQNWRFDGEIEALLCEGRREIALDVEGVGMSGASAIVWYRQKPAQATSQRWSFRPPTAENASRSPPSPFPFVPLPIDAQSLPLSPLSSSLQASSTDFNFAPPVNSSLPPPPLPNSGSIPPPLDPAALPPPPLDATSLPPPPVCPPPPPPVASDSPSAPSSDTSLPLPPPPPPLETDQPTPLSPSSPSSAHLLPPPPPPSTNVADIEQKVQSLNISSDNQNPSSSSPLPSAPFSAPNPQPTYPPSQSPYPAPAYPPSSYSSYANPSQYPSPPLTTSQYQPPYYPPPPGYAPPYAATSSYAPPSSSSSSYVSYATPSAYPSAYPSVNYSTVHSSGYSPSYPLTTSTYATPLSPSSYTPLTSSSYNHSLNNPSYSPSLAYSSLGSFSPVSPSSPSLPSSAATAPPTGMFFIGTKLSDAVLDVDRNSGLHVITWPRKQSNFTNQLWRTDSDGYIYSLETGLVLEVEGDNAARAGSRVRVWYKKPVDHETSANQRWRYDAQSMAFVNYNGLCLDIDRSGTNPGTALLAWTPLGNRPNQQFYFIPYTN